MGGRSDPRSVLIVVATSDRRGAELEAIALTDQLRGTGWDARVLALTTGTGTAIEGIEVLGDAALHVRTLHALRAAAEHVDIVIAYGSTSLPACAIALVASGTPFVYRSIGDPADWVRGTLHRLRTRAVFRRPAHVVALWRGATDGIERLYGVPAHRLSVIPNARDPRRLVPPSDDDRAAARSAWGITDDRPVIVTLGALVAEKQIERAIQAVEMIPESHLLIAGGGELRDSLTEVARHVPTHNVEVVGPVDDPRSVLHAADTLLLSSRTEGMPGVIIEAGLCGVPTVTPPVGAVTEMIEHNVSGIVTQDDRPTSLADGVRTSVRHREDFGTAARQRMERQFSWETVAPMWDHLLRQIASR